MKLRLYIGIILEGQGKQSTYWRPGRSPTVRFLQALLASFRDTVNITGVTDTGGIDRTLQGNAVTGGGWLESNAAAADDTKGIVVGTGTTAMDIEDNSLGTLIGDGSLAGELDYGGTTIDANVTIDSANDIAYFEISRTFQNNSGSAITVEEAGIYGLARDSGDVARYFCYVRDLTGGIAVPNGSTLTVTYRLQISA